jgi:hypothetical protein
LAKFLYIRIYFNLKEMKLAVRAFSLLILAAVAAFYVNCSGDDNPGKSDQDAQIEKLNGTWTITTNDNVTLDGIASGEDYTGFTLDIDGQAGNSTISYSVSGQPDLGPWPGNGSLSFGNPVTSALTRDDNIGITYSVTETTLIMEFTFTGEGYSARTKNVEGTWRFTFTKAS